MTAAWVAAQMPSPACCDAEEPAGGIAARAGRWMISSEEAFRPIQSRLLDLERQIYDLKKRRVDGLLLERLAELEAQRLGLSSEEYLRSEVEDAVSVSEAEIDRYLSEKLPQLNWWQRYRARSGVEEFVRRRNREVRRAELLRELLARHGVQVFYQFAPPRGAPFPDLVQPDDPFLGNALDPLARLVVFSDYQCPHCRDLFGMLHRLNQRFKGRLLIHYKDYPLRLQPVSIDAAVAARVAFRHGKLFEMQTLLFRAGDALTRERILSLAESVQIPARVLVSALEDPVMRRAVVDSYEQGRSIGITATPTVVLGGSLLRGNHDLEFYERVISHHVLGRLNGE